MARKPLPNSLSTPLQQGWRPVAWEVPAMLASIPPSEYEAAWAAFARASRGTVSVDWSRSWKDWCRAEMTRRGEARRTVANKPILLDTMFVD